MSASNEWFEYHLTESNGWVEGSEKLDFADIMEKSVPQDRVMTLVFHERFSSIYSKCERWYDTTYRSNDEQLLNALVAKYGETPEIYRDDNYHKRI